MAIKNSSPFADAYQALQFLLGNISREYIQQSIKAASVIKNKLDSLQETKAIDTTATVTELEGQLSTMKAWADSTIADLKAEIAWLKQDKAEKKKAAKEVKIEKSEPDVQPE